MLSLRLKPLALAAAFFLSCSSVQAAATEPAPALNENLSAKESGISKPPQVVPIPVLEMKEKILFDAPDSETFAQNIPAGIENVPRTTDAPAADTNGALSPAELSYLRDRVIPQEASFFEPGVGIDPKSGMPFDHVRVRLYKGLLAETGNYTAASKLSLSIPYLLKVIQKNPAYAKAKLKPEEAEDLLERTLKTLLIYLDKYPDHGGFLPWVDIRPNGTIAPANTKVPSLDNGQMTWALAAVVAAFEENGTPRQKAIAASAQKLLNAQNYRMFYDEKAKLLHGTIQKDQDGKWVGDTSYYLNDMFEGILAVLWGVLHGQVPEDAWYNLKIPTVDYKMTSGETATTFLGFRASFHEHWALGFLPLMESELAPLYQNFFHVQADFSRRNGLPGFLSTAYDPNGCYRQMGVRAISAEAVDREDVAVVFATAMAMLINPQAGVRWLKALYEFKNVNSKFGAVESVGHDGYADIFTADAKGMTLLAASGGITGEIRHYLWTRAVPRTGVPMYIKLMELLYAKNRQMMEARGNKPILMPSAPYPEPPGEMIHVRPMAKPTDPGESYDITGHLQKGHLHGKNVRSAGLKTLEDDVQAGKIFEFDFEIPPYYPYFDQWAFRGTYIDQTTGIARMNYLSMEIPGGSAPILYEIELKSDDIALATAIIDTRQSGTMLEDGWIRVVKPIHPIPDSEFKAFNYFAVAIHDPHYLLGQYASYGNEGRVTMRNIKLTHAHPETGEVPSARAAADHLLLDLTPYWRMSHGYLPVEVHGPPRIYSFEGGRGWRGGYSPYVDLSKFKYMYLRLRNTSPDHNVMHIELKHENEYLPGYKIPVHMVESGEWRTYRLKLPQKTKRALNYIAVSDPKSSFEMESMGLSNEEITGPDLRVVETNPEKQRYRWYRPEPQP